MATLQFSISRKATEGVSELLVRFYHGKIDQRAKSGIYLPPERWNGEKQSVNIPRLQNTERTALIESQKRLEGLRQYIFDEWFKAKKPVQSTWLSEVIDCYNHPELPKNHEEFSECWKAYVATKKTSLGRLKLLNVVHNKYLRFCEMTNTSPNIAETTKQTIIRLDAYLREEHIIAEQTVDFYEKFKVKKIKPRGENIMALTHKTLKSFFKWCQESSLISVNPYEQFKISAERYGTPYYLTIAERNHIAEAPLSSKALAVQRDIFIFQCLTGVRFSDLFALTKSNIQEGFLEYVQIKKLRSEPYVVRVPLNQQAQRLVESYADKAGKSLFPFISGQKYNDAIKKILTEAEITRLVTVINPTTGQEEKKPINEIGSSHLARRTFIGNLYAKVKDPNLIGSMSGHKEGSRAFARYRNIDDEIKRQTIDLLE